MKVLIGYYIIIIMIRILIEMKTMSWIFIYFNEMTLYWFSFYYYSDYNNKLIKIIKLGSSHHIIVSKLINNISIKLGKSMIIIARSLDLIEIHL